MTAAVLVLPTANFTCRVRLLPVCWWTRRLLRCTSVVRANVHELPLNCALWN